MRGRERIHVVVLRILGLLLLIAAALKAHQLLTEPLGAERIWSAWPLLIAQVEFELVLGVWLLSGLFKRTAWVASFACVSGFSAITFHKGLTDAASCGCLRAVCVSRWITLTGLDLPALLALILFRPIALRLQRFLLCLRRRRWPALIRRLLRPASSQLRFSATAGLTLAVLGATTPILAFHKPAAATPTYEVLEPKTWIGLELPILPYIDIAEQLKQGARLLLFYHHDCPHRRRPIPQYEQVARGSESAKDSLRIGFIEVPGLQRRMAQVRIPPFSANPIITRTAYGRGKEVNGM